MTEVVVWILVVYLSGYKAGGPMLVDDIATKESCEAAAKVIATKFPDRFGGAACIPVRKKVPRP